MSGKKISTLVERRKLREREQSGPVKINKALRGKPPDQLVEPPRLYMNWSRPHSLAEGAD